MIEKKKIRVLVVGLHYPLSMMLYFIRALQRRNDVELITAGPFTGTYIPWSDAQHPSGMHLPAKYLYTPTVPLPASAAQGGIPYELIENRLPFKPDLILEVDAGWHLKTKPKDVIVAHVMTDPHVLSGHYAAHAGIPDVSFNMQGPYMRPGDVYLPYAYDPTIFYPEELEKINQGCLIGLHYPQRDALVQRLRHVGYKVHYSIGEIFDENRTIYNQSDIALSWSSLQDTPARVWEALGMSLPLVCNRTPDLSNFFVEGEHYMGFNSVDEAEKKFSLLMSDDSMRWEMGSAAWRKVKDANTFDHRITQILETVKLI